MSQPLSLFMDSPIGKIIWQRSLWLTLCLPCLVRVLNYYYQSTESSIWDKKSFFSLSWIFFHAYMIVGKNLRGFLWLQLLASVTRDWKLNPVCLVCFDFDRSTCKGLACAAPQIWQILCHNKYMKSITEEILNLPLGIPHWKNEEKSYKFTETLFDYFFFIGNSIKPQPLFPPHVCMGTFSPYLQRLLLRLNHPMH